MGRFRHMLRRMKGTFVNKKGLYSAIWIFAPSLVGHEVGRRHFCSPKRAHHCEQKGHSTFEGDGPDTVDRPPGSAYATGALA